MTEGLKIKIWGTRGSMTAPYPDRMKYGANTSCVSAEWDEGLVIFDCGSGIRALGEELLRNNTTEKKELHIFVSHLHLDHVVGLPFFPIIYNKNWKIHLYGFFPNEKFREKLTKLLAPPYWPVALENAGAGLIWHELKENEAVMLPGNVRVKTICSSHPDSAILMRMEKGEESFVYGLDCELTDDFRTIYEAFVKDSSLLLFDGMYNEEELKRYRGFGHSSWEQGLEIQENCNVKQICISHHDWGRTDTELEAIEKEVSEKKKNCIFAKEEMEFFL